MLPIYKLITTQLKVLNIPCYADLYPKALADSKVYPHIIYNFPNTFTANFADLNQMEIDIMDNKTSMVEIETISKSIDDIFKRLLVNNSEMFVKTYRNAPYRLKLDEEGTGIQRRQLRYVVKAYYK